MRSAAPVLLLLPLLLGGADAPKSEDLVAELGRGEYSSRRAAALKLLAAGTDSVPALVAALKSSEEAPSPRMPALAVLDEARAGRPQAAQIRHLLSRITGRSFRTSAGWAAWWKESSGKDRKALVGAELKAALEKLQAKDALERRFALQALARVGRESEGDEAAALLGDKDASVRIAACRALAEVAKPHAAAALKDLMGAKDPNLRREVLEAASLLEIKEARSVLAGLVAESRRPLERLRAVEQLSRYADPAALSAAAAFLGRRADQNAQLRLCTALGYFPQEKVLDALRKALADPKTDNPAMLAGALAVLGERSDAAVAALDKALKAPLPAPDARDPDKRVQARQARLFAARIVADAFPTHSALRNAANAVLREHTADVNASVDRGVKALRALQEKEAKGKGGAVPGAWPFKTPGWAHEGFKPGPAALALLALRKSGVPEDDPDFALGMKYVRDCASKPPVIQESTVYAQAMLSMLLSDVDPSGSREAVKRIVDWIQGCQITAKSDSFKAGQWGYYGAQNGITCSISVTHYALLALGFSGRTLSDASVRREVWQSSLDYFRRAQRASGGWGYDKAVGQGDAYGTMTAAGVTSLLICEAGLLGDGFREFDARESRPVRDGLDWLADRFGDAEVPEVALAGNGMGGLDARYYWYYTLERMALLLGTEYVGNRHWYHDLSSRLLEIQDPAGGWTGTERGGDLPAVANAFALLVLKRAPLPIQIESPRTYEVEEAP